MKYSPNFFIVSGLLAVLLAFHAGSATGGDFYLKSSQTGSDSWATADFWSDDLPAAAGNNYYVGGGLDLRSPQSGDYAFPGDALYLGYNIDGTPEVGRLVLKTPTGQTTTVSSLILGNGTIANAVAPNANATLAGAITVNGSGTFASGSRGGGDDDGRKLTVSSTITGAGSLLVTTSNLTNGGQVIFSGDTTGFTGKWTIDEDSYMKVTNNNARLIGNTTVNSGATLELASNLGNNKRFGTGSSVTVESGGVLKIAGDDAMGYNGNVFNLYLNGGELQMAVNRNETLGGVNIYMESGSITASTGFFDVLRNDVKFFATAADGATAGAPTVSTISSRLNLRNGGSPFTIDVAENARLNIDGQITGSGHFTKTGDGVLAITLAGGNTMTGNVTIDAGKVIVGNDNKKQGALGGGTVTVKAGATLETTGANSLGQGNDGGVMPDIVLDGGTLIATPYLHVRNLTLNNGTVARSAGTDGSGLDFYTTLVADAKGYITSTGTSSIASRITVREKTELFVNVDSGQLTVASNFAINGATTGKVIKTGDGVLIQSAMVANTAPIVIADGEFRLQGGGDAKRFSADVTVNEGALLNLNAKDSLGYNNGSRNNIYIYGEMRNTAENETLRNISFYLLGGEMTATVGQYDIYNSNVQIFAQGLADATEANPTVSTISAPLNLRNTADLAQNDFTIDVAENALLNITGQIYPEGTSTGAKGFTKTGDGVLVLGNGTNSFTGGVIVSGGTLKSTSAGALSNVGKITLVEGATLDAFAGTTLSAYDFSGEQVVNMTGAYMFADPILVSGELTVGDDAYFSLGYDLGQYGVMDDLNQLLNKPFTILELTDTGAFSGGPTELGIQFDLSIFGDATDLDMVAYWVSDGGSGGYGAYMGVLNDSNSGSAVPEPATWLMMLLGIAGLGVWGYRRKKV